MSSDHSRLVDLAVRQLHLSRRQTLLGALGVVGLWGCKQSDARGGQPAASTTYSGTTPSPSSPVVASSSSPGGVPSPSSPSPSAATRACGETEASIEGPYYRANAPSRFDLTEPGMLGTPLEIEGRITTIDCKTPLVDAEIDVWQATHNGHYDNDGTMPANSLLLRGKIKADGDGRYRVKTIVPGRYLNGKQYRPAHVHVKIRAASHPLLTTQLYFPDDPYNDIDPFIHKSLIMDVKKKDRVLLARYDFVLRPTS